MTANLTGCPGFEADASYPRAGRVIDYSPPATLTFSGFTCGSNEVLRNDCVAGTFDLHLDGEFSDGHGEPTTILDQHLRFEGVACGGDYHDVACPTP